MADGAHLSIGLLPSFRKKGPLDNLNTVASLEEPGVVQGRKIGRDFDLFDGKALGKVDHQLARTDLSERNLQVIGGLLADRL